MIRINHRTLLLIALVFWTTGSATSDGPVCGNDGQTYENIEKLNIIAELNPDLELAHEGECLADPSLEAIDGCAKLQPRNKGCTNVYDPVCANDGKTYPNKCTMCEEDESLLIVSKGDCKVCKPSDKDQSCTMDNNPICASNGKTYTNKCVMCSQNPSLTVDYQGECHLESDCPLSAKVKLCPKIDDPVCASNGRSYANKCKMCRENPNLKVSNKGECKASDPCRRSDKDQNCPRGGNLVCASNGKTYLNKCSMCSENTELTVVNEGICKPRVDCRQADKDQECGDIYKPVCASNGQTFPNKCTMCSVNPDLTVVDTSECHAVSFCLPTEGTLDACTKDYKPVCANNGRTYLNKCTMCKEDHDLTVVREGLCHICTQVNRRGFCSSQGQPICGTDGETYPNKCAFCNQFNVDPSLDVQHYGACQGCPNIREIGGCSRNFEPVCGSDGNTYNNFCLFCLTLFNQSENSNLVVKSDGPCDNYKCKPYKYVETCSRKKDPVCGSDGVTYDNLCSFCQAVKLNDKLEFAGDVECKISCPGRRTKCTLEDDPICAFAMPIKRYINVGNPCDFCNEQLIYQEKGGDLFFEHYGECK